MLSILSRFVNERGGQTLLGEYIPTAKNNMVSEFYSLHDFLPSEGRPWIWEWDLSIGEISWPNVIQLSVGDGPSNG